MADIDFGALTGDVEPKAATGDAFEFTPEKAEGEPFENGNGEPLVLMIHPKGGAAHDRAQNVMKLRATVQAKKIGSVEIREVDDMSEEEIDAQIATDDAMALDYLSRMTAGWNLVSGGEPVEFTLKNCRAFYGAAENIRAAVDAAMVKKGDQQKK